MAAYLILPLFRQGLNCAVQHGNWRCGAAALLGCFLPKLRAARKGGLFSREGSSSRSDL